MANPGQDDDAGEKGKAPDPKAGHKEGTPSRRRQTKVADYGCKQGIEI